MWQDLKMKAQTSNLTTSELFFLSCSYGPIIITTDNDYAYNPLKLNCDIIKMRKPICLKCHWMTKGRLKVSIK